MGCNGSRLYVSADFETQNLNRMEKYKNNKEAAKAYADLLQLDTNTEQGKLQYESACLDFVAGANWKDEQLRLSNVSNNEVAVCEPRWKTCTAKECYYKGSCEDCGHYR